MPSVSKILVSTREFHRAPLRRAEDTELILSEIIDVYPRIQNELMANRPVSDTEKAKQRERSDMSLRRLNELHSKYPILNDDYLFTLALFVGEPIRWVNAFEWRKLDIREINAFFKVWYDIGLRMNIKGIPNTIEDLMAFKKVSHYLTAKSYMYNKLTLLYKQQSNMSKLQCVILPATG